MNNQEEETQKQQNDKLLRLMTGWANLEARAQIQGFGFDSLVDRTDKQPFTCMLEHAQL